MGEEDNGTLNLGVQVNIDDMQLSERDLKILKTSDDRNRPHMEFCMKANIYIEKMLVREAIHSTPHKDCYSSGITQYRRKDGEKITAEDVRALRQWGVSPGGDHINVRWEIDSSG